MNELAGSGVEAAAAPRAAEGALVEALDGSHAQQLAPRGLLLRPALADRRPRLRAQGAVRPPRRPLQGEVRHAPAGRDARPQPRVPFISITSALLSIRHLIMKRIQR